MIGQQALREIGQRFVEKHVGPQEEDTTRLRQFFVDRGIDPDAVTLYALELIDTGAAPQLGMMGAAALLQGIEFGLYLSEVLSEVPR